MTQPACKHCGHPRSQHRDDMAGICLGCKCAGYEPRPRDLSNEAWDLAQKVSPVHSLGQDITWLVVALQDVIDQRDSWHRDCQSAVKQRDEALKRGEKLAEALKQADEEIGRLKEALTHAHETIAVTQIAAPPAPTHRVQAVVRSVDTSNRYDGPPVGESDPEEQAR